MATSAPQKPEGEPGASRPVRPAAAERREGSPRAARAPRPWVEVPALRDPAPPTGLGGRIARALRPPRKLRFTREGKYYLGITLGVGFAAINTGNNLLYLLLGMLLSLIVVSGVMSDLSLRHLTVTRRLPTRAQVGRPHLVEIEVYNHKRRIPSYAIEVEDLRAGQPADKRCFFLKVSPTSAQVAAYRRTPARRGRDRHTGFRIATRFPFGLFEKSREVAVEGELVIYPAVDPIRIPPREGGRGVGNGASVGRGGGDDIYTLRKMREGDDPRDIYWRKSTSKNEFVLRERTQELRPDVEMMLDVVRPATADDDWSTQLERRIREIASRAVAHVKRGDPVIVRTTVGDRARADRNVGADPVLRFLALMEPVAEDRADDERARRRAGGRMSPTAATSPGAGTPGPAADPSPSPTPASAGGDPA